MTPVDSERHRTYTYAVILQINLEQLWKKNCSCHIVCVRVRVLIVLEVLKAVVRGI